MTDAVLVGNIEAFRLADVLAFLSNTRKSGMLTLESDEKKADLFFEDGGLVYAGSNQESFRLGSILLRKNKISPAQCARIDELIQRGDGRFGELAVQENVFSADQLRDFLKVQVSEIVFDAFVWTGGTFAFTYDMQLPVYAVTIAIDLPNLIMEGARRIEEWEQCARLLPDSQVVFRVVATPRDEKITLTVDEWKILFLINGQRTLEDLCADADDRLRVYRVVYGLYANKLIEKVRSDRARTSEQSGSRARLPAEDATMRQDSPRFGAESTVRDEEPDDDTNLLVSSENLFSYSDVVQPTIAQLRIDDASQRVVALTELEYLIGRHRDNGIQIADLGVSGFHARVYRGPEGYAIEDLKSRNGTWVNGTRVFHATLSDGDRVHVGQTDLIFEVLSAAPAPTN